MSASCSGRSCSEPHGGRRSGPAASTAEEQEYVACIAGTGLEDYAKTPGNLGFEMLLRDLGDGESEVTTLSWWASMDAIRAFAGATPELAARAEVTF